MPCSSDCPHSIVQMGTGSEVDYHTFLINGRAPESPFEFLTGRSEKVRLRVINPSGSIIYRFAVAGHKLTVTHPDSLPVKPVEVDTIEIAPGERYDVLVNADNPGVWTIAAIPADGMSNGGGRALLRYSDAQGTSVPTVKQSPIELGGRNLSYGQLIAVQSRTLPDAPERRIDIALSGGMMSYAWTINGQAYPNAKPFDIRAGELIRLMMTNNSMMRYPMHLRGHSFRLLQNNAGDAAPLKDTIIVNHMESVEVEFLADNPGDWAFHCHNAYHMDTGMMRVFKYV